MKLFKLLVATIALSLSSIATAEVAVIVNSANGDALKKGTVKRIFLKKIKSFSNGSEINVISLPADSTVTNEFNQKALNKSGSQIRSYWSKLVFTGAATPPTELATAADVIAAVKADPNAIGFIEASAVTGDVKVVLKY